MKRLAIIRQDVANVKGDYEFILRMNGGGKNERQAPPHHEAEPVMILKSG